MDNIKNSLKSKDEKLLKLQIFKNYRHYSSRIKKTFYYNSNNMKYPTIPLSLIIMEIFKGVAKKKDGQELDPEYIAKAYSGAFMTPCSVVLALYYLNQLNQQQSSEYFDSVSPSDLFIVSVMVASKYLYEPEDVFLNEYAEFGNKPRKELFKMELEFLDALNWNTYVDPSDLLELLGEVELKMALSESSKRGWATYTDLVVIFENSNIDQKWKEFLSELALIISVASLAYVITFGVASALLIAKHQAYYPDLILELPLQSHINFPSNFTNSSFTGVFNPPFYGGLSLNKIEYFR